MPCDVGLASAGGKGETFGSTAPLNLANIPLRKTRAGGG
jgi:hypothetical protein